MTDPTLENDSSADKFRPVLWAGIAVLVFVGVAISADYFRGSPESISATFVGRSSCIDCHKDQADKFQGSHHDLAMDLATDETVIGNFEDATIEHDGMTSRMFRQASKFMVNTEGPDGQMQDFEVKYVFGVDPLQQYMVEFDRTEDMPESEIARLQVLRISWDTQKKRWFYLRPPDVGDKLEPEDPLHWTGIAQRWQTMCADCHSTDLKTNFDVATNTYHTTFSEIDVSCEACHGPGSVHVELANRKSLFWDRKHGYGLAKLKGDDATTQLESCAPCHSRRSVMDAAFHAGDAFCDHYNLELLRPDTYHDDGQIKDEVYVYGSFVQSKMYHKGIRCTDCHDPHSLELKFKGNETCTSCHQHEAAKYDVPSHHHHKPGTPGAMCVNCHMPHTTYMEVDARRDHSLRVPRPDLSVKLGTPNACSQCHVADQIEQIDVAKRDDLEEYADWLLAADQGDEQIAGLIAKTDQWCDEACEKWYGDARLQPTHFAETLVALRNGSDTGVRDALRLAVQPSDVAPAIARATALSELMARGEIGAVPVARKIAENQSEEPIVRAAAIGVLGLANPKEAVKVLVPLLKDERLLIRTEATRTLAQPQIYQTLTMSHKTQVDLGLKEVKSGLMVAGDRAGAHMGWAMLCEQRGQPKEAIESYETAMRLQPEMTGPRTNLAALYENLAQGQQQQAQQLQSQRQGEQAAMLMQQAAMMMQQAAKLRADELPLLGRDAALAPDNGSVQYRYGLALYLAGDSIKALEVLKRAVELEPDIEQFQLAVQLLEQKIREGGGE